LGHLGSFNRVLESVMESVLESTRLS